MKERTVTTTKENVETKEESKKGERKRGRAKDREAKGGNRSREGRRREKGGKTINVKPILIMVIGHHFLNYFKIRIAVNMYYPHGEWWLITMF